MDLTNSSSAGTLTNAVFNPLLNRIMLAVVIMLVGFIAGKLLGLLVRRFLSEIQFDKHLRNMGVKLSLERSLGSILSFIIYVVTLFLSINTLGLTSTIVTLLMLAIVFVFVISFLLAVKDFFPNLMSGLRIKISKVFSVGDDVQIREVKGRITHVGLLETRLVTEHKEEIIIPNALFTKRKIRLKRRK